MSRSTKSAPPRRSAESSKTKSKTFQLPEGYKQSSVQEGIEDALRLHNARFSDILAVWDTDGDGTVSRKEFIAGLASMGIRGSKTDFGALFDFWDIDQGGSLDAKELQRALRTKDTAEEAKAEIARRRQSKLKGSSEQQLMKTQREEMRAAKAEREAELDAAAEALREAAGSGDMAKMNHLCSREDGIDLASYIDRANFDGTTALHKAAMYGHSGCIEILLQKGGKKANIDGFDGRGRTALMLASFNGEVGALKALLQGGASLRIVDSKLGRNAIMFGIMGGHVESLRFLAEQCERGVLLPNGLRSAPLDFAVQAEAPGGSEEGDALSASTHVPLSWMEVRDKRGHTCEDIARDCEATDILQLYGELKTAHEAATREAEDKAAKKVNLAASTPEKEGTENAARTAQAKTQRRRGDDAATQVAEQRRDGGGVKTEEAHVKVAEEAAAARAAQVPGPKKNLGNMLRRASALEAARADAQRAVSHVLEGRTREGNSNSLSVRKRGKEKSGGGFLSILRRATAAQKKEKQIRAAFDVFDTDGSGSLSAQELKAVLSRPGGGAPLTSQEAQDIIDEFDINGDGELQFDEFRAFWDPNAPVQHEYVSQTL